MSGQTILFIFLFFLVSSCAPSSWEELQIEANCEVKKLTSILQPIDTKDQLEKALPKIKRQCTKIAKLMLEARTLKKRLPLPEAVLPSKESEALFTELARLYEMPGLRILIEKAEGEALSLLSED